MKIVIGLGNPGEKYRHSRHNAGFMMADKIVVGKGSWHSSPNMLVSKASLSLSNGQEEKLVVIKPQTFMNNSGSVVSKIRKKYPQVDLKDWYVIHDDLDLELGKYKIEFEHGPKQHNGLDSIYEQLGSKQFWHVRLGIDNRQGIRVGEPSEYVLQPFPPEEKAIFDAMLDQAFQELKQKLY